MNAKNNIIIISGPAGSGKDSVISALSKQCTLERVVTSSTRAMRIGESEGHPYYFISREKFEAMIKSGAFFEYSINENNEYYGVTQEELNRVMQSGKLGVWKMEWKGVISVKKLLPFIKAIFIIAPLEILELRLRQRDGGFHDEQYFAERMEYTREWFKHSDIYDFTVINKEGKLNETVTDVTNYIRQQGLLP